MTIIIDDSSTVTINFSTGGSNETPTLPAMIDRTKKTITLLKDNTTIKYTPNADGSLTLVNDNTVAIFRKKS